LPPDAALLEEDVMRPNLGSRLTRIGLLLLVGGSSPLLLTIAAAKLGLTGNPHPNLTALGTLSVLTFWPGLILLIVGTAAAWWQHLQEAK
jgi:hypothetical protein